MRLKTDLQKLNISFSSFTTTIMKQIKTKPRAPCSSACSTDRINLLNLDFHSCICRQTPEPSSEDSLNPFCTSESVTRCNTTPSHAPPYRLSGGISSGEGKSVYYYKITSGCWQYQHETGCKELCGKPAVACSLHRRC